MPPHDHGGTTGNSDKLDHRHYLLPELITIGEDGEHRHPTRRQNSIDGNCSEHRGDGLADPEHIRSELADCPATASCFNRNQICSTNWAGEVTI